MNGEVKAAKNRGCDARRKMSEIEHPSGDGLNFLSLATILLHQISQRYRNRCNQKKKIYREEARKNLQFPVQTTMRFISSKMLQQKIKFDEHKKKV